MNTRLIHLYTFYTALGGGDPDRGDHPLSGGVTGLKRDVPFRRVGNTMFDSPTFDLEKAKGTAVEDDEIRPAKMRIYFSTVLNLSLRNTREAVWSISKRRDEFQSRTTDVRTRRVRSATWTRTTRINRVSDRVITPYACVRGLSDRRRNG